MKKRHTFYLILKQSGMIPALTVFILCVFGAATLLYYFPSGTHNLHTYQDSLWFIFVSVFTVGYGDIYVTGLLPRLITVFITIYGVILVALIPGIFAAYFQEVAKQQKQETALTIYHKLKNLPNLTKDELEMISNEIIQEEKSRGFFNQFHADRKKRLNKFSDSKEEKTK